jgi:hypothetical protein
MADPQNPSEDPRGEREEVVEDEEETLEEGEDAPEDHYEPTAVEATRGREQGLGVGARDLERQRDAHRPVARVTDDEDEDGN